MERMRDGMRLGCLGFWLNCCLLAGCLGLWLAWRTPGQRLGLWLGGFARLESLARGFARLGSLARLADIWTAPGSLARGICQAWVSGSTDPKKVPAFFEFAGTFFTQSQSRPTETLFTAQSGLTRELLTPKFHIDPRTSLRMPPELSIPLLSALVPATTSLLHKIFFDQSLHISHIQWILLRLKS